MSYYSYGDFHFKKDCSLDRRFTTTHQLESMGLGWISYGDMTSGRVPSTWPELRKLADQVYAEKVAKMPKVEDLSLNMDYFINGRYPQDINYYKASKDHCKQQYLAS